MNAIKRLFTWLRPVVLLDKDALTVIRPGDTCIFHMSSRPHPLWLSQIQEQLSIILGVPAVEVVVVDSRAAFRVDSLTDHLSPTQLKAYNAQRAAEAPIAINVTASGVAPKPREPNNFSVPRDAVKSHEARQFGVDEIAGAPRPTTIGVDGGGLDQIFAATALQSAPDETPAPIIIKGDRGNGAKQDIVFSICVGNSGPPGGRPNRDARHVQCVSNPMLHGGFSSEEFRAASQMRADIQAIIARLRLIVEDSNVALPLKVESRGKLGESGVIDRSGAEGPI